MFFLPSTTKSRTIPQEQKKQKNSAEAQLLGVRKANHGIQIHESFASNRNLHADLVLFLHEAPGEQHVRREVDANHLPRGRELLCQVPARQQAGVDQNAMLRKGRHYGDKLCAAEGVGMFARSVGREHAVVLQTRGQRTTLTCINGTYWRQIEVPRKSPSRDINAKTNYSIKNPPSSDFTHTRHE